MLNRCPNCGGLVYFDIQSGQLKCESCDSLFVPETFESSTGAQENSENAEFDMSIFTCPNCGGSVASNELEAVEYCLYCGSFVTLESQVKKIRKPDFILPFSKTKEECKKSYSNMIMRKFYAPKEFRDEKFLNGFKGIYIPYWVYDYKTDTNVALKGSKETRHGDYIHTHHYDINCRVAGNLIGLSYDASSSFDDDISSRLVPFDSNKLKPFNSSYMYGFFADTADVNDSVYVDESSEIVNEKIWDTVSENYEVSKGYPTKPSEKSFSKNFGVKYSTKLAMIPIWFLTWRNKDRVAYSVMNGDNGEIYSEVPVDIKRYFLFSLLLALPIFFGLNYLVTFSVYSMLKLAIGLSFLMVVLYTFMLDRIVSKNLHVDDKGYTSVNENESKKASKVKKNAIVSFWGDVGGIFKKAGFWGIIVAVVLMFMFSAYIIVIGAILIVVAIIYIFVRIGKNAKWLDDKSVWLDLLGSFGSMLLSVVMLFADPAGDISYYIAAIVCIMGAGLTAVLAMRRYNELATRPLPHFFDRKAGGEN